MFPRSRLRGAVTSIGRGDPRIGTETLSNAKRPMRERGKLVVQTEPAARILGKNAASCPRGCDPEVFREPVSICSAGEMMRAVRETVEVNTRCCNRSGSDLLRGCRDGFSSIGPNDPHRNGRHEKAGAYCARCGINCISEGEGVAHHVELAAIKPVHVPRQLQSRDMTYVRGHKAAAETKGKAVAARFHSCSESGVSQTHVVNTWRRHVRAFLV